MVKRLYHILALIAVICLFAGGGLLGYMFAAGKLSAERLDQIAMVLRGELPKQEVAASQPAEPPPRPMRSREELARIQDQTERAELLAQRLEREHEDRNALNEEMRLHAQRMLEQIDREKAKLATAKAALEKESGQQGFETALEMLSSADANKAKDILMRGGQFKEADVVRLLMAMSEFRRKKLVNACKTEEEVRWIGRILTQIHNLNSDASTGVDGSGGAPPKGG